MATSDDRRPLARAWSFWLQRPRSDLVAAVLLTLVQIGASLRWATFDLLGVLSADPDADLPMLLLAAAAVVGLINAFALAALAIYREPRGRRLRVHRQKVGLVTTKSWLSATLGSVTVAFVMMLGAFLEAADVLKYGRWVVNGGALFALVALPRLLWVFYDVLLVDAVDATDQPGRPPPSFVSRGRSTDEGPATMRRRKLSEVTTPHQD